MDLSSVAQSLPSVPADKSSLSVGDAAALTVFKKSVDLQAQNALQLIASVGQGASYPTRTPPPTIGSAFNASA